MAVTAGYRYKEDKNIRLRKKFPHRGSDPPRSNFYTEYHIVYNNKRRRVLKGRYKYLYGSGIHKTQRTIDTLPEWYISGTFCDLKGFARAKGIKDLVYIHNQYSERQFEDDLLLISYDQKIEPIMLDDFTSVNLWDYTSYSLYTYGENIKKFVEAVKIYSPEYDTTQVEEALKKYQ